MPQDTTFATLKQAARDFFYSGKTVRDERIIIEGILKALELLADARDWPWLVSETRITTRALQAILCTIAAESTSVQQTDTPLLVDLATVGQDAVGRFALFDGNARTYRIESIDNSDGSFVIRYAYRSAITAAATNVVKFAYDLPDNFRSLIDIRAADRDREIYSADWRALKLMYDRTVEVSTPDHVAIFDGQTGDNPQQMWFYPIPDAVEEYTVDYYRYPAIPSADADVIDWPTRQMSILKTAFRKAIAKDFMPTAAARADSEFELMLMAAATNDKKRKGPHLLGRGHVVDESSRNIWWRGPFTSN